MPPNNHGSVQWNMGENARVHVFHLIAMELLEDTLKKKVFLRLHLVRNVLTIEDPKNPRAQACFAVKSADNIVLKTPKQNRHII